MQLKSSETPAAGREANLNHQAPEKKGRILSYKPSDHWQLGF